MSSYFVTTWDTELQRFTPQEGVRCGPYTLFGLRKAIRELQYLGYPANRDDSFVFVSDYEPESLDKSTSTG